MIVLSHSALQVQFVWFDSAAGSVNAADLIEKFFGAEPDLSQSARVVTPQTPFLSMAQYSESGVQYSVNVGPGRIDLFAAPSPLDFPPGPNDPPILTIDGLKVLNDLHRRISTTADDGLRNVFRLSVVVQFVDRCSSLSEAAAMFGKRFSGDFDTRNATDLMFQGNVRKKIPEGEYEINRLVQMQVATFHLMAVPVDGQSVPTPLTGSRNAPPVYCVQTTFDVNVNPTGKTFTVGGRKSVFSVLCQEVQKLRLANLERVNLDP